MIRYEIRAATTEDEDDLLELARYLNSVNLPHDRDTIRRILMHSEQSFRGEIEDVTRREYIFVLRDRTTQRAVGTSLIVSQLGRRDAPYIYFEVRNEERYSATLDRHFSHDVLSIGYSYDGPTEIGGLVIHPDARLSPDQLGMLISYVRFAFLATHRNVFQSRVLAELLPPLEPDGTSRLWEAVGRKFTGLDYGAADRLSKLNKEFIRGLFPSGDIYVSLLPDDARAVIGKVGVQTRGVEKLLRRIGFRYWNRVDPFDGGPHFIADMDDVSLIQRTTRSTAIVGHPNSATRSLVCVETPAHPFFQALAVPVQATTDGSIIDAEAANCLSLRTGTPISVLPLDR